MPNSANPRMGAWLCPLHFSEREQVTRCSAGQRLHAARMLVQYASIAADVGAPAYAFRAEHRCVPTSISTDAQNLWKASVAPAAASVDSDEDAATPLPAPLMTGSRKYFPMQSAFRCSFACSGCRPMPASTRHWLSAFGQAQPSPQSLRALIMSAQARATPEVGLSLPGIVAQPYFSTSELCSQELAFFSVAC